MRYKDENKIKALHQAVIDVVIRDGYQDLSVSNIAKQAGVSPATLYIYYSDKKAMLGQVYLNIKGLIDAKLFANFDPLGDVEEQFKLLLRNYAEALNTYPQEALVMGVFNEKPDLIPDDMYQEGMKLSHQIQKFYQHAVGVQKIRNVDPDFLIAYTFYPTNNIAQNRFKEHKLMTANDINLLIEMAWQACKA